MTPLTENEIRIYYNLIVGSQHKKIASKILQYFGMAQPGWAYFGMSLDKSKIIQIEQCPELIEGMVPVTMVNPDNWIFCDEISDMPVSAIDWIPDPPEVILGYCWDMAERIGKPHIEEVRGEEQYSLEIDFFEDDLSIYGTGKTKRESFLSTMQKLIDYHYRLNMPSLANFAEFVGDKVEIEAQQRNGLIKQYIVVDYHQSNRIFTSKLFENYFEFETGKINLMEGSFYLDNKRNSPSFKRVVGTR